MDISTPEIKSVIETLPIGLYAKRRVPLTVVDGEKTSYYNAVTDEIVISADIIKEGMKMIDDPDKMETAIRSMCYHEVSHAILTPRQARVNDCFNIFEDERIETIFSDYYLDTDFKQQLLNINGFKSIDDVPKDGSLTAMQKFYSVVRFGIGEKKFLDRVDDIIRRYSRLTGMTEDRWLVWDYENEISRLYRDITGENPPPAMSSPVPVPMRGSGKDKKDDGKTMDGVAEGEGKDTDLGDDKSESGTTPAHGRANPLSKTELDEIVKDTFIENKFIDKKLTDELSVILENFSKKNNSGSAVATYSGVFNPRSVARREDYKFFDRKASVNGTNKFGTFHLNLFVDESGSFCSSETAMNTLLRSLTEIEKRNKNFTLDVVFCGISERLVTDKRKRVFKASGGNRLDKKTYEIYRKLQKPNTFNYNIACFDGDACSDGGRGDHGFGAFDHNNCTIISDSDNRRYIDTDVHSAKVIYTRNYTDELIRNVTDVLAKAFR